MQVWGGLVTGLGRPVLRSWKKRAQGPGGEVSTLVPLGFGSQQPRPQSRASASPAGEGGVIDQAEVGHAHALIVFISLSCPRLPNPLCEDYQLCLQRDPESIPDVSTKNDPHTPLKNTETQRTAIRSSPVVSCRVPSGFAPQEPQASEAGTSGCPDGGPGFGVNPLTQKTRNICINDLAQRRLFLGVKNCSLCSAEGHLLS
uniref:Uncharacterized protein n=1 Tax=Myotis myotis TaxID=51298 RepID=A0A7J7R7F6_MYOMY|nr:hypothetical protein mMyoMyo1_010889 [Myotis myotis]